MLRIFIGGTISNVKLTSISALSLKEIVFEEIPKEQKQRVELMIKLYSVFSTLIVINNIILRSLGKINYI